MGINRSQDYAKLTTNIALKTAMETVPIFEVLRLVTTCMANQQNGRRLVVHPMDHLCSHFITDRHFLTDNLLCLVSNAAKYSDQGATTDLRISLVEVSASQAQLSASLLPKQAVSHSELLLAAQPPHMPRQRVSSNEVPAARQPSHPSSRRPAPPLPSKKLMVLVVVEDTGTSVITHRS
jgi:hypothetical protein